jgi:hypothetical protein
MVVNENVNANVNKLVKDHAVNRPEKMRSSAEITARYNLSCKKYKELKAAKAEFREQKVMVYAELKVLGWVLGKNEQTISKDAN